MMQRLFVTAFGWSLLVACGDGGQPIPNPPPGGVEQPLPSPENPKPTDQRPTTNSQDPVSSPLPGSQGSNSTPGAGGSDNGGGGRGNVAGDDGNPGPGGACTPEGQCLRCADLCASCKCSGVGKDQCVSFGLCK